jgi:hypothetical protein
MGKVEEGYSLEKMDDLLIKGAFELDLSYKKALPCHRLDSSTGGLVICSKNKPAEICIKMCFRQKLIHKRYRAVVPGRLEPSEGSIGTPVFGKESLTRYNVVKYTRSARYGGWLSTVDLWPITGRKHQLRKHLLSVGHPILGDKRYSFASSWPEKIGGKEFMFLWSLEVEFPHPINTYSKEENDAISSENVIKVALEVQKSLGEEATKNLVKLEELDDKKRSESNTAFIDSGNTTSGQDKNSIESRLLRADNTQLREEMFGIDSRKKVRVIIDEPPFYEIFRNCHADEWNRIIDQKK